MSPRLFSRFMRKWFGSRERDEVERLAVGELVVPSSFPPDDVRSAPVSAGTEDRAEFDELLDKARTQYREALDELRDQ